MTWIWCRSEETENAQRDHDDADPARTNHTMTSFHTKSPILRSLRNTQTIFFKAYQYRLYQATFKLPSQSVIIFRLGTPRGSLDRQNSYSISSNPRLALAYADSSRRLKERNILS